MYRIIHKRIQLKMNKDDVPQLIADLVAMQVQVFSIRSNAFIGRLFSITYNTSKPCGTFYKLSCLKYLRSQEPTWLLVSLRAFIFLIQLGLYVNGKDWMMFMLGSLDETMVIDYDKLVNGYAVCFFVLNLLLVHVPILVALVAGDVVSGEASMGTLRLLAAKPVSRTQIILAKYFATAVYVFGLLLWIAVISLVVSVAVFGKE